MTQTPETPKKTTAEDILEAFNAEDIVDDPGKEETDEPSSPADDADAPAP